MKKPIMTKCLPCKKSAALCLSLCLLSGCTMFDSSLEGLLHPPKLTETQTAVYNALILSTGDQIDLVYPAGGEYRSAFVLYDLDDEKTEEAIVFYREKNLSENGDSGIRMNFLDQKAGVWSSVTDRPVAGTKIESVNFYSFDGTVSIGVICSAPVQAEKSLSLLKYSGEQVEEQFKTQFSFLEAADLDNDSLDELFFVSYDSVMGYSHARVFGIAEGSGAESPEVLSTVPLYPEVSSVQRLTRQKPSEGISRRANAFTPMLFCTDIDGDGRIEAPATTAFIGYENRSVPEQIYSVEWYYADTENNNTVTKKCTTYVSTGGEYIFYVPVRWQGLVTVEKSGNTVSFVKYDSASLVLLSVCVSDTLPEGSGWEAFSEGIYVNNSDSADPMVLTDDELKNCLTVQ